jgi:hypothetical protein
MLAHPYGLANAITTYQEALRDRYANQIGYIHLLSRPNLPEADQFAPTVNMVHIC